MLKSQIFKFACMIYFQKYVIFSEVLKAHEAMYKEDGGILGTLLRLDF